MVSLSGLSAVPGGFQEAESTGLMSDRRRQEILEADLERGGLGIAGQALPGLARKFNALYPGAQFIGSATGGPSQPPQQPGQPSVPMVNPPSNTVPVEQPQPPAAFAGANTTGLPPMDQFIAQRAALYGHDPATVLKAAYSEGLTNYPNQRVGDQGQSFGPFQLYTGGGMGNEYQQQTGINPAPQASDYATSDYAIGNLARTGWTPYHGAARVGIGPRQGIAGAPGALGDAIQGRGGLSIQDAITEIERVAPHAPPEMQMRALKQLAPYIKMDERQYLLEMNRIYQQQRIEQGQQRIDQAGKKEERVAAEGQEKLEQGRQRLANPFMLQKRRIDAAKEAAGTKAEVDAARQAQKDAAAMERVTTRIGAQQGMQKDRLEVQEKLAREKLLEKDKTLLSDDAVQNNARRWLNGDQMVMRGLKEADRAAILNAASDIASQNGMSMDDQLNAVTGLAGRKTAAQTAGRISTYINQAGDSFEALLPIVKDAFDTVQAKNIRTQYPTVNAFLQATDSQLGDKNIIALKSALQGAINEYAQVMNRGRGVATVFSQKKAEEVLNSAWNTGQFGASIDVLQKEVKAVRDASEKLISKYKVPDEAPNKGDTTGGTKEVTDAVKLEIQKALAAGVPFEEIIQSLKTQGYKTKEIEGAKPTTGKRSEIDPNMLPGGTVKY